MSPKLPTTPAGPGPASGPASGSASGSTSGSAQRTPPQTTLACDASGPVLSFRGVTRTFGRTRALDGIDLDIAPGSVVGLCGRNGAGKTTMLRLAQGILWPDTGTLRVCGFDPVKQGLEVRTRASLLSEESALYPWLTVGELIALSARLHPRWDAAHAETMRRRLDLDPRAKIKDLSRGTKAKLALTLAVAPRPQLLLLDDPTAGLDPLVRREVLEGILDAIPGEGGAVVYASHLIGDLERVADRIVFLDRGRVRVDGAVDELKSRVKRAVAVFDGPVPGADELRALLPGTLAVETAAHAATVIADAPDGDLAQALRARGAARVTLEGLSLEDVLVAFLAEGRRAGSGAGSGAGTGADVDGDGDSEAQDAEVTRV